MKRLITWMYLKFVFLPNLKKLQEKEDSRMYYMPSRVDPHWYKLEQALYEKKNNTLH